MVCCSKSTARSCPITMPRCAPSRRARSSRAGRPHRQGRGPRRHRLQVRGRHPRQRALDPQVGRSTDEVSLGEEIDALVMTEGGQRRPPDHSKKRARFEKAWRRIEAAPESGEPVQGTVIEVVKGGLIIDLGVAASCRRRWSTSAACRTSTSTSAHEIECQVIEMNRSRNNVVLSRRAVLEEERKEVRQQIIDALEPGLSSRPISNIVDFGAFVDLDGIDGLIHISELSWSHVNHPSEVLQVNQEVKVKVLDIDRDRQRISLGSSRPRKTRGSGSSTRKHRRRRQGRSPRSSPSARSSRSTTASRASCTSPSSPAVTSRARARSCSPARGARQDHRDRLRPPPPVPLDQARRGTGAPLQPERAGRTPERPKPTPTPRIPVAPSDRRRAAGRGCRALSGSRRGAPPPRRRAARRGVPGGAARGRRHATKRRGAASLTSRPTQDAPAAEARSSAAASRAGRQLSGPPAGCGTACRRLA